MSEIIKADLTPEILEVNIRRVLVSFEVIIDTEKIDVYYNEEKYTLNEEVETIISTKLKFYSANYDSLVVSELGTTIKDMIETSLAKDIPS